MNLLTGKNNDAFCDVEYPISLETIKVYTREERPRSALMKTFTRLIPFLSVVIEKISFILDKHNLSKIEKLVLVIFDNPLRPPRKTLIFLCCKQYITICVYIPYGKATATETNHEQTIYFFSSLNSSNLCWLCFRYLHPSQPRQCSYELFSSTKSNL